MYGLATAEIVELPVESKITNDGDVIGLGLDASVIVTPLGRITFFIPVLVSLPVEVLRHNRSSAYAFGVLAPDETLLL